MLYFHIWLFNKGRFLVLSEYYNQFGIYQPFRVSLLESRQSKLSNLEADSEPCQTSKMECFANKHSILNIWQGSEYHL